MRALVGTGIGQVLTFIGVSYREVQPGRSGPRRPRARVRLAGVAHIQMLADGGDPGIPADAIALHLTLNE